MAFLAHCPAAAPHPHPRPSLCLVLRCNVSPLHTLIPRWRTKQWGPADRGGSLIGWREAGLRVCMCAHTQGDVLHNRLGFPLLEGGKEGACGHFVTWLFVSAFFQTRPPFQPPNPPEPRCGNLSGTHMCSNIWYVAPEASSHACAAVACCLRVFDVTPERCNLILQPWGEITAPLSSCTGSQMSKDPVFQTAGRLHWKSIWNLANPVQILTYICSSTFLSNSWR